GTDAAPGPPAAAPSASASRPVSPEEIDPVARVLRSVRILRLKPVAGARARAGMFEASLEGASIGAPGVTTDRRAWLSLARNADPVALRRPLAFSRLAAALGFHVVPTSVRRSISAGELGALLADQPATLELCRTQARIQNDGTVDALLTATAMAAVGSPWPELRTQEVDPRSSLEARAWERALASPVPVDGERPTLVRDFVEMLVLDYLASFALRRTVVLLPDADALVLDDNREAFPSHVEPASLTPLLHRLRGVARHPSPS